MCTRVCLQGARRPRGARSSRRLLAAGYWVRWRRQAERAYTRCAVHANAENAYFHAKDSAMASRPTLRNTKGIYARTGTEPNNQQQARNRTPGAAAARLLPVAAVVAVQ